MARTLIIAFLATLATTLVLANDLNLGGPAPNDYSVKNATVIRKPRINSQKAIVVLGDGSNITSIRVVDHNVTNNATVSVAVGGLGQPFVVLDFESPPLRGMHFTVEVKGVHQPKPTPPPKPTTTPQTTDPTPTPSPSTTSEPPAEVTTESAPPAESTTGSAPPAESTTGSAPPAEVTTESEPPAESTTESAPPAESTTGSAPPAESTASEEEVEENEEEARLLNQVYYANRLF